MATTITRREIRRRGFFGWVFLLIFLGFNALMLSWAVGYGQMLAADTAANDAERAGKAIGGTIGFGMLLVLWACGSVITGLLAILTRGRKTLIEEVR